MHTLITFLPICYVVLMVFFLLNEDNLFVAFTQTIKYTSLFILLVLSFSFILSSMV